MWHQIEPDCMSRPVSKSTCITLTSNCGNTDMLNHMCYYTLPPVGIASSRELHSPSFLAKPHSPSFEHDAEHRCHGVTQFPRETPFTQLWTQCWASVPWCHPVSPWNPIHPALNTMLSVGAMVLISAIKRWRIMGDGLASDCRGMLVKVGNQALIKTSYRCSLSSESVHITVILSSTFIIIYKGGNFQCYISILRR